MSGLEISRAKGKRSRFYTECQFMSKAHLKGGILYV